ncbi:MAG TPA: hypothetical protein VFU97_05830 [Xanthobacteraceae bacterium]|nr:hypothetical protein [Xanthobacteraceae bacterium]
MSAGARVVVAQRRAVGPLDEMPIPRNDLACLALARFHHRGEERVPESDQRGQKDRGTLARRADQVVHGQGLSQIGHWRPLEDLPALSKCSGPKNAPLLGGCFDVGTMPPASPAPCDAVHIEGKKFSSRRARG